MQLLKQREMLMPNKRGGEANMQAFVSWQKDIKRILLKILSEALEKRFAEIILNKACLC